MVGMCSEGSPETKENGSSVSLGLGQKTAAKTDANQIRFILRDTLCIARETSVTQRGSCFSVKTTISVSCSRDGTPTS